jgi:hypothetical protein
MWVHDSIIFLIFQEIIKLRAKKLPSRFEKEVSLLRFLPHPAHGGAKGIFGIRSFVQQAKERVFDERSEQDHGVADCHNAAKPELLGEPFREVRAIIGCHDDT